MRMALAAFAVLTFITQGANGEAGREMTLILPHALHADEAAWLEVSVGVLGQGKEIHITTPSGQPLGTISPFGIRTGQESGTYTVPLPADVISGDRVSLRLSLSNEQRAPTSTELKSVKVKVTGTRR